MALSPDTDDALREFVRKELRGSDLSLLVRQLQAPAVVTALPPNPANGQEILYLADDTNGVIWHLKYRAASASAYKWEFVGGHSLFAVESANWTTITSTAAWSTDANGPAITLPLAGDYEARYGYNLMDISADGQSCWAVAAKSAAAANGLDPLHSTRVRISNGIGAERTARLAAQSAADVIAIYNVVSSGTGRIFGRSLAVRPIRVG